MQLRPIRNGCIVEPDAVVQQGPIHIPVYMQGVGRPSGKLLAADDKEISKHIGKRVLLRTAAFFQHDGKTYWHTKCNQILAILDTDAPVKILEEIERCQWCKSAGEGNMIQDHNGYCIQCGKNRYGEHRRDRKLKVSDEEIHRFGRRVPANE